jgi:ABC-type lipoprotein release transport system permease subunit
VLRDVLLGLLSLASWRMALRNVGRHGRRTGIVLTAVAVGLGGILATMSVNYGMVFQMVETAIRTEVGHLQIHGRGYQDSTGIDVRIPGRNGAAEVLAEQAGLSAWTRRLHSEALVFSPRASVGVRLVGIEPEREAAVTALADSVVEGEYLGGQTSAGDGALRGPRPKLLMGVRLAERLKIGVADKVVLSVQDVHGDMTGEAYRVGGLFRTASRELDETAVYLRLEEGQRLLDVGDDVSSLVLVTRDGVAPEAAKTALVARLDPTLEVQTWKELRPLLVSMIQMFDSTGWVIYAAVFIAMAFGIANVLLMSVYERIREIGIMMAIGMRPGRLVAVIVIESMLLTLAGVFLGFVAGLGAIWALRDGIDLSNWGEGLVAFGIPTRIIPVLRSEDLLIPVVVAVITAILASLWPAVRAARTRPAEAVRHV